MQGKLSYDFVQCNIFTVNYIFYNRIYVCEVYYLHSLFALLITYLHLL